MNHPSKQVLLIDPPSKEPSGLNTGLGWLAANIVDAVKSVTVLGLSNIYCTLEEGNRILKNNVLKKQPNIIGFNIHCTTYKTVLVMIKELRRYYNGLIVIGGPHAIYAQENILMDSPEADLVVLGEAEYTMAEICQSNLSTYHGIEGVIFRDNGKIINNPKKFIGNDLGNLKHPDYRQFGITRIHSPYPLSTSRGCPFKCCFCNPFMGGTWRPRPLESVFEELDFAMRTFGIKSFKLVEPVFNLRPSRVIEFCEELLHRKIDLPWYSASGLRADCITPESVRAMKKAGCTHIKIGVETLVPEIFKHINKGEKIEDIQRAVQHIKAEKMELWGSFIIGLPFDTLDTVRRTYELSKKLGFDFTEWSLLIPYPGTQAYEWMEANGAIYHSIETAHQVATDSAGENTVHVACDTPDFPKSDRIKAYYEINWKSGNYIFSITDPFWKKAISIIKGISRYDPFRIPWHAIHIAKLLKRRWERTNEAGEIFDFSENTF